MIVIKLGGSLIHTGKSLVRELVGYTNSNQNTIIIVPGGSIFADLVRKVDASQEAAHWMAVLAMEQYGYYLGDGTGAKLIQNPYIRENGTFILLPYFLMKNKDELPHSWDVTSDTIAAWAAFQIGARFIKVTDVDGIFIDGILQRQLNACEIIGKETCVDAELPHFLMKNHMNCEIINGNYPGRLIDAIEKSAKGTLIKTASL